jgi:hypothetical protein
MLKVSHSTLVIISGLVWLAVGCFLLPLGLKLLVASAAASILGDTAPYPLLASFSSYVGGAHTAAMLLIALGLIVGQLKGRKVLSKSIHRSVKRIKNFPNPTSITNLYGFGYLILFASMVLLGMSIRYFGVPSDIRGLIDVAIGAALIQGSILYFREAQAIRKASESKNVV